VLARFHGISEPVNDKAVEHQMWEIATRYTPAKRVADYTQAIMDLGATLCTRSKPDCKQCPFVRDCVAYAENKVSDIPAKKATKRIPTRQATFLLIQHRGKILLSKRPASGIWGGLWSLPEFSGEPDKKLLRQFCRQELSATVSDFKNLASFRHTFSHYHLDIHPVMVTLERLPTKVMEAERQIWYNPQAPSAVGLPKPVQFLLSTLT
jgi:A/G-specific adenine glycosylase